MPNAECRMPNAECGMRNAECGMQNSNNEEETTVRLLKYGAVLALSLVAATAQAQKYPSKPIRMIVGYAPGGGRHISALIIAPQITEALGQQVVVENRAGAAQNVAAEYIIKQPADGYTVLLSSAALGVNISLYAKLNYPRVLDFVPIAVFSTSPNLLLVHPSYPA